MITGTSYFPSEHAAITYYRAYEGHSAARVVREKLASGEIHIGKPPLKHGERCYLIDAGTRWAIEESR